MYSRVFMRWVSKWNLAVAVENCSINLALPHGEAASTGFSKLGWANYCLRAAAAYSTVLPPSYEQFTPLVCFVLVEYHWLVAGRFYLINMQCDSRVILVQKFRFGIETRGGNLCFKYVSFCIKSIVCRSWPFVLSWQNDEALTEKGLPSPPSLD